MTGQDQQTSAREQMVEKAARAALEARWETTLEWRWDRTTEAKRTEARKQARAVLDAVLPQVSTVEELEALPKLSVVLDADGGVWTCLGHDGWLNNVADFYDENAVLIEYHAPLTVVWTPPTA